MAKTPEPGAPGGSRANARIRRPLAVIAAVVALAFLGLTALGGGIEMLAFPHGNRFVKAEWLDHIPLLDTWVVPGLVLGVVFGLGSFAVGFGLLRKPDWPWLAWLSRRSGKHWSWAATIMMGFALLAWLLLELLLIPERSVIEAVYSAVGVLLIVAPLLASARQYLATPR